MTAATRIERTGPAIRATLAEHAPSECAQFETEIRRALTQAGVDFDLGPAERLLDRWWGIATIRANPLSEHEQQQVVRARGGDDAGLLARSASGAWVRL